MCFYTVTVAYIVSNVEHIAHTECRAAADARSAGEGSSNNEKPDSGTDRQGVISASHWLSAKAANLKDKIELLCQIVGKKKKT